ncbi:hypothetical protein WP8W19C02_28140 [Enterobacter cloacae]|nr:hypothetical protein WP8W19C02_28140 [Enterobacter cloacae]
MEASKVDVSSRDTASIYITDTILQKISFQVIQNQTHVFNTL